MESASRSPLNVMYTDEWLDSAFDSLYNSSGSVIATSKTGVAGTRVGQELDGFVTYIRRASFRGRSWTLLQRRVHRRDHGRYQSQISLCVPAVFVQINTAGQRVKDSMRHTQLTVVKKIFGGLRGAVCAGDSAGRYLYRLVPALEQPARYLLDVDIRKQDIGSEVELQLLKCREPSGAYAFLRDEGYRVDAIIR